MTADRVFFTATSSLFVSSLAVPAIFWTAVAAGLLIKGPLIFLFVALAAGTLAVLDRSVRFFLRLQVEKCANPRWSRPHIRAAPPRGIAMTGCPSRRHVHLR